MGGPRGSTSSRPPSSPLSSSKTSPHHNASSPAVSRRPASAPRAVGGVVGAQAPPITLSLDHLPDSSRGSSLMGRNSDGTIERCAQSTTAAWEESSPSGGSMHRPQATMHSSRPSPRSGSGSGSTAQPHPLSPLDVAVAAATEASRGAALILEGPHQQHNTRQPLIRPKRNSSPGQLLPTGAGAADQTDLSLLTVEALGAELEAVHAAAAADAARWRSVCGSLQAEIDEVCL